MISRATIPSSRSQKHREGFRVLYIENLRRNFSREAAKLQETGGETKSERAARAGASALDSKTSRVDNLLRGEQQRYTRRQSEAFTKRENQQRESTKQEMRLTLEQGVSLDDERRVRQRFGKGEPLKLLRHKYPYTN